MSDNFMNIALPELPSFPLPPLPPISDDELAMLAVTHSSNHGFQRRPNFLDFGQEDKIMDYEKLEHVGDAILGSVVTTLLHDLFPYIQPGPATLLKGCLVSNNTLAQLSSSYNFPDRIVAAPSALYTTRLQVKTRASVFEAYIAAVFYDFLASEVPGAYAIVSETTTIDPQSELDEIESRTAGSDIGSAPSRGSPAQSPAQHPIEEEGFPNHMTTPVPDTAEPTYAPFMATVSLLPPLLPLPTRTRGQAYDYVERWLRPLFAPAAQIAIEIVRQEAGKVAINVNGSEYISGATGCLNSWAAKNTGTMPTYDAQRDGVRWRVECHVVLEDGTVHTASAVRDTKKAATSYAAYVLCKELSLDIGEK